MDLHDIQARLRDWYHEVERRFTSMSYGSGMSSTFTVTDEYEGFQGWRDYEPARTNPVQLDRLGAVRVIEVVGGDTGDGDYQSMVFEVTNPDGFVEYFRKDGFFDSYGDPDEAWDGEFKQVNPVVKTITVYE